MKLSFENALKVPPIITESGITLNAAPPWNMPMLTTCKVMAFCSILLLQKWKRLKVWSLRQQKLSDEKGESDLTRFFYKEEKYDD